MIVELVILAALAATLLATLWAKWDQRWIRSAAILALLPVFLHLFLVGYRWQMAPAHLLAIALNVWHSRAYA